MMTLYKIVTWLRYLCLLYIYYNSVVTVFFSILLFSSVFPQNDSQTSRHLPVSVKRALPLRDLLPGVQNQHLLRRSPQRKPSGHRRLRHRRNHGEENWKEESDTSKSHSSKNDTSKSHSSKNDTSKSHSSKNDTSKSDRSKNDTSKNNRSKNDGSKNCSSKR